MKWTKKNSEDENDSLWRGEERWSIRRTAYPTGVKVGRLVPHFKVTVSMSRAVKACVLFGRNLTDLSIFDFWSVFVCFSQLKCDVTYRKHIFVTSLTAITKREMYVV